MAELDIRQKNISFAFVDNSQITRLNNEYFGRRVSTDVISFYLGDSHDPSGTIGEVIISIEQAGINAGKYKVAIEEEVTRYIVHGVLHLLGYDDLSPQQRKKMKGKEDFILTKVKMKFISAKKNMIIKK